MGSLKRRLERLGASLQPTERPMEKGGHEEIRRALDRVAFLRYRQRVAADALNLESEEDRQAWAIFDAGRNRAEGRGLEQMPRCSHVYGDSSQCKRIVSAEQTYCYSHDPARQGERKRNAARGGKAKASGEIGRVKARLQALADAVEEGQMDRADAAVCGRGTSTSAPSARN